MATYQVQSGDSVDAIAKRFGVTRNAVSGYRSNDPNVILPGEILEINTQAPIPMATSALTGKPVPGSISGTNLMTPAPTQAPQVQAPQPAPVQQQPQAPTQAPAPQAEPLTTTTPEQTAAYLKAQSLIPQENQSGLPGEEQNPVLSQYGINTSDISTGFQTNPMSTLSSLVEQVMKATGLPDVKQNIMDISGQIESLANERDDKIREIQDDPWRSASTKATQINALNDKYEQKIANRTDRLTLLQSTYEDARQQAQFAATTAINLYDNERAIQADQLEKALDRAEKKAEAERKLQEPLSVAEAKALGVPYGTTAAQAYGITPKEASGGTTSPIVSSSGETLEYGTPEYIEQKLLQTANFKTNPVASERESLGKFQRVIYGVSDLASSLKKTTTDPIIGALKNLNPYSFDARSVNAQINALVPNVARGVYGEVGVLTDTDIERYLQTLPNIKSTKQQNDFVTALTLKNAQRAFETDLLNMANSRVNVSGYVETYRNITKQVNDLEASLGVGSGGQNADVETEPVRGFWEGIGNFLWGND